MAEILVLQPNEQYSAVSETNLYYDGQVKLVCRIKMAEVPDVSCTIPGQPKTGRPYGHIIAATCRGENWSSSPQNQSAATELKIKIK